MADKTLVVKGGTLIDGTGKAPLEHAVIIIENGRFKEIGRAGQIKEPEGAEVRAGPANLHRTLSGVSA